MVAKSTKTQYQPRGDMTEYATFSIVAVDPNSGEMGSAIASCALAVGFAVPYFNLHGVVHTQHHASPAIAANILSNLEKGVHPSEAIQSALASDIARERRQIICLNSSGVGAAFSGTECQGKYHQIVGHNFVAGGNTLAKEQVIDAMAEAFNTGDKKPMSLRLLSALVAGEVAGGDKRGKQSASLRVVNPRDRERWYMYPDLRVDDHHNPLEELNRLHDIFMQNKQSRN